MNCNKDIHNELINMGKYDCPFCNLQLMEVDVNKDYRCCDNPDIINNSEIVCKNCGIVQGHDYVKEFVDFYENKYKFRRKSVYHRKYHIENIIFKKNIEMTRNDMSKICNIFDEIQKIVLLIDKNRKRLISINFLLRQIIRTYFPHVNYQNISITKSEKTLKYYKKYWNQIIDLIGDNITDIIQK